ncbi:RluA family pseudouridine synthase [Gilvimarinus agarilyticus]|uniref:RluA family pseudouridine synthase n=1 Tax=Gilvimarinus sp. 2_MG-2023 TaxID=3062666 RepID=UPI001C081BC0|nr:RluA family pseudouridine synthase [Gilvimarinus sp. 2_MG-2023]MBU2887166.1 RluA family pseudouridine synthase [Gilvimarinus agarilyticus]MDO6571825.1 RluA family pseudouridine synthase [Gilvimarinus sp. 2_MG-2023]
MNNNTPPAADQLTVLPKCHDPVRILRRDKDFLLIEKPAGLLSVPGRNPANHDCVASRLQLEYPTVSIVHRLDFDTSGIMVVALNKPAHAKIARQFQERQTFKLYYAVVAGGPPEQSGVINLPIAPDAENRPKCKIDPEGKPSVTHYKVLAFDEALNRSLVALEPKTGRSHQLRLHMAHLGCPILGCEFYAPEATRALADRLLLHASELRFTHPHDDSEVSGVAERPFWRSI